MADKMRWRYGDTNPVVAAVESATVIEIGDLVWHFDDAVYPASDVVDQGAKSSNQEWFTNYFLGVAMQRTRSGDTSPVRVATTGVFEFDCSSTSFVLGQMMGADENAAGDALEDQTIAKVAASQHAVGRVAKREPTATTSVLVDIRSSIMTGGVICRG